jgi:hypothetical protein
VICGRDSVSAVLVAAGWSFWISSRLLQLWFINVWKEFTTCVLLEDFSLFRRISSSWELGPQLQKNKL